MSTRQNLNIFLRDPKARAVAMCLDALVRMDPGAVAMVIRKIEEADILQQIEAKEKEDKDDVH